MSQTTIMIAVPTEVYKDLVEIADVRDTSLAEVLKVAIDNELEKGLQEVIDEKGRDTVECLFDGEQLMESDNGF